MPQTEATDATASLLVSSKVLSLASPVFAALLSPDFLEGNQVRRGHCPVIKLQDDDPAAMTAICNILHFRYDCVPSHIGPEQLAEIGILSDKYDCSKALQPWSAKWLSTHQTPPSELGHMLLAAYKLNDADHFASISAQVIRTLEPKRETWDISPQLESLPDRVKGLSLPR